MIKLGRNFSKVRGAARRAEVDGRAVFVERASSAGEHRAALADVNEETVPYMSLVLVPGPVARARASRRRGRISPSWDSGPPGPTG